MQIKDSDNLLTLDRQFFTFRNYWLMHMQIYTCISHSRSTLCLTYVTQFVISRL